MRNLMERSKIEVPLWTNPFSFMRRMTEEMDRVFGPESSLMGPAEAGMVAWTPALEVFERDNMFVVRAELPGLAKEDVKINVTHDELTIEGERKVEKEEKREGFYRTERQYGSFYRRIALPEHVKSEAAKATFKDGMLEIAIPTIPVPEVKKRTLEIQG